MIRIAVFGSEGRMGKLVREESGDGFGVEACYDVRSPGLSPDRSPPPEVQVVVDFSAADAWADLDGLLKGTDVALVSGTTGLGDRQRELLDAWAVDRAVFWAANMSRGVYVLRRLLGMAAKMLDDADIELVETHHKHKTDSPSGTAVRIAEDLGEVRPGLQPVYGREGDCGARRPHELGIHSLRGGDVPGDHSVGFFCRGESVTLRHSVTSRRTFALGALRAAAFVAGRPPGRYGMQDLITYLERNKNDT
ncbi:4-hydroxy-tetrahydrodipicolinate reductase [Candidatus Fermentibacteria bacterium]|nr:4-hydroxy-tetrahydrodipicolinate reductase [Candidatus Fermentibacteria bacterium]